MNDWAAWKTYHGPYLCVGSRRRLMRRNDFWTSLRRTALRALVITGGYIVSTLGSDIGEEGSMIGAGGGSVARFRNLAM